jgi:small redox-active disulfide protein 2
MTKRIQVLGPGCAKCGKLAQVAEEAARTAGLDFTLEKVSDIDAIVASGAMMTPALVVDGQVKVAGRVPSLEEMKRLLG